MKRLSALIAIAVTAWSAQAFADPLDGITIGPEVDAPYNRTAMYGSWRDDDGDCQKTRAEVLIAESLVPATLDSTGCKVEAGVWFDPYTGLTFTEPGDLDIDHFVLLKEAHQSGAHAWTDEKRKDYTNGLENPGHLIAVDDGTNQSKGHRDPADWLPPNEDFHCAYVLAWTEVKRKWDLMMDTAEVQAIRDVLADSSDE